MFTEIDGRSLRTAEEERIEREKELKRTEFQRKKSFFESESATEHSSTTTENKSGSDGSVNNWICFVFFVLFWDSDGHYLRFSFINSPVFCSEFQSISRIVKFVHSVTVMGSGNRKPDFLVPNPSSSNGT